MVCLSVLLCAVLALCCMVPTQDGPIPRLSLEGDISRMKTKADVRDISFTYWDGSRTVCGYAAVKIQGNSSLAYGKKNYTIKLYQDRNHGKKLKIDFGWGRQNQYCLKANWIDFTHARNIVSAKLVAQAQQKYNVLSQTPRGGVVDGFPVEVYANGDFLGLYTWNIPKDAWMFAMDKNNPNHIVVCSEGWQDANLFRGEPDFESWSLEMGEQSAQTLEKLQRLFDFIQNSSDEAFRADFEQYVNLDAALNYYIMADFGHMQDNTGKNMLLATYDGEVWYPLLYDMDTSWGSFYNGETLYPYDRELTDLSRNLLFARMETCFAEELTRRYWELREDILTRDHVMAEFETFRAGIPEGVFEKELHKWAGHSGAPVDGLLGFDYSQIEDYLDTAIPMLDEKYRSMQP